MSILEFPRINFRGIFNTNPCTANNDDVMPSVVTRDTNRLGEDLAGKDDIQAQRYLSEEVEMQNYEEPTGKKAFIRTGWNPYGDHITTFDGTSIRSVVLGPTERLNSADEDPIVGIGFELIGALNPNGTGPTSPMIVDLDPTGLVSTQLFIGGVRLFSTDAGGARQELATIYHDTRAFQNWLNFNSTVAETGHPYAGEQNFVGIGCMWQFVIPAEKLPDPDSLAIQSPGLKQLLDKARAAGGIAIRFQTYEVEPGYTDKYLGKQIEKGNGPHNPAYGYLVGTIGIWHSDEPCSEPAGRKLEACYRTASPDQWIDPTDPDQGRPDMQWSAGPGATASTLKGCAYPWMGAPALIGNVVAHLQSDIDVISLDLGGAFPKYGFRNPDGPTDDDPPQGFDKPRCKAYVGEVELAVIPAGGGEPVAIADVDYGFDDFAGYDDFGGVVDLPFDTARISRETIAGGQLILRGKADSPLNSGVELVKETLIRLVTDNRTAYLTAADSGNRFHVKVYERGGPTTRDVTLYLREYKTIIQLKPEQPDSCTGANNAYRTNQSVDSRTDPITVPPSDNNPPQCPPAKAEPSRLKFASSDTIPAGTTDWFPIEVTPNLEAAPEGGTAVFSFQLEEDYTYGTMPPAQPGGTAALGIAGVPMWSTKIYSSVRIFAPEDFSGLYDEEGKLKWEDVYQQSLRYYFLLFPAMSAYIPLNLESSLTSPYAAKLIQQRLHTPDKPEFYTTLNMPVTRTLSPDRVKLVLDFIAQSQS